MRFALASTLSLSLLPSAASAREITIGADQWRVIESHSGSDDYYTRVSETGLPFLRGHYRPPMKTTVLGWEVPDDARRTAQTLRWKWRAETLPIGGNECAAGKEDSAADIYATWKRGLRWYTLKYVWSSVGRRGAICDSKRNLFLAQDTVILESGGPTGAWKDEAIDLKSAYRRHFEDGRLDADVPEFVGIGLMSDGDQTHSESAADYAGFVLEY